ncbi:GTPase domain-containing protein [Chitinophaga pendula]|uniref:GTPase domain-containing protein n=1 Tax=Chitinophaga TaxID=79328 RepID=UPI000BB05DC2|nr:MULTISPECIES: GTPase domain-containing protein [Chitinophaga]ASZ11073.1 hypothetical protein CK934_08925 [Chitinophaga sp. MD30]UCJ05929.1 GTPase domain-containing protein [Chitinophaga pendula]
MNEQIIKLQRATSPAELAQMSIPTLAFDGTFYDAFGEPESTGIWFIWGDSGSGKTSFIAQFVKYLTRFDKLVYNALEEGRSKANQRAWDRVNMKEVTGKIGLVQEPMEHLTVRMDKRKSAGIVVVDSAQYAKLTKAKYFAIKDKYEGKKLIIFVSHADGKDPRGSLAKDILFDASLKIWVEGYRAFTRGRSIGPKGYYDIWPEGAAKYWGENQ